ncbi:hypothetical protein ACLFLH_06970 [Mammaliicoccus sciuri]|uniref:hypothetical protein n=1 Tax=Mammaliicoccus sciuri TaxID=1296 RepID=UPI00397D0804
MPTIKKIVRMNLTELIDWIWKNNIKDKKFVSEYVNSIVFVSKSGKISTGYSIGKTDTFKVEVEEPITERTNLDTLVEVRGNGTVHTYYDTSIREEERDSTVEFHTLIDGNLVLIWDREEGLVE